MNENTPTENQGVEVVDYNQLALQKTEELVGKVDFGVFMSMFVMVIGVSAGAVVGFIALKKGWGWIKQTIKRFGS